MNYVYVLFRSTGFYSDRRDNPVRAYLDETLAMKAKTDIEDWFKARPVFDFDKMTDDAGLIKPYWKGKMRCPLDPDHFKEDMHVPDYYVAQIELRD